MTENLIKPGKVTAENNGTVIKKMSFVIFCVNQKLLSLVTMKDLAYVLTTLAQNRVYEYSVQYPRILTHKKKSYFLIRFTQMKS